MKEYWAISVDDISTEIYDIGSGDVTGAHYIGFEGDRSAARAQLVAAFTAMIDRAMYRATSYGSRWEDNFETTDGV